MDPSNPEQQIVGRPPSKLIEGDTIETMCAGPRIPGRVHIVDGKPFVRWVDRVRLERVRGAIARSYRRPGEVLDWERDLLNSRAAH